MYADYVGWEPIDMILNNDQHEKKYINTDPINKVIDLGKPGKELKDFFKLFKDYTLSNANHVSPSASDSNFISKELKNSIIKDLRNTENSFFRSIFEECDHLRFAGNPNFKRCSKSDCLYRFSLSSITNKKSSFCKICT